MDNILTPFVDAILISKFPQRQMKFEQAKQTLVDGVANREIYNPEYVQAKDAIRRALDNAFHIMHEAILDAQHAKAFEYFAGTYDYWDFSMGFDSASVPKQYRILTKKFNGYAPGKQADPEQVGLNVIYRYMDVLSDALKMVNLFKEAKPFIVKGRKPAVLTDAQRVQQETDLKNTGICPVCMKRQKLTFESTMVAHGYTIPRGWGGRNGMCMGRGYKAWELAPDGAIAFKKVMEQFLADLNRMATSLKNSEPPILSETVKAWEGGGLRARQVNKTKTYEKGTREYEHLRIDRLYSTESSIDRKSVV